MPGFSPKLPLQLDNLDGIGLNTTFEEVVKQNIKMLLLTIPGEKVMDPEFGVGLHTYLFEPSIPFTYDAIEQKISEQLEYYYPFVQLKELNINENSDQQNKPNSLSIEIRYVITANSLEDILEIVLDIPEF
tara:strand:- start:6306 stop:6698 length:393 start_codon:yes stop_codon:yes gene_type:complete